MRKTGRSRVPVGSMRRRKRNQDHFDLAIAIRVKEARIIEWHNRWNRDEALEAAGLSE
jgi:hypothetical protein